MRFTSTAMDWGLLVSVFPISYCTFSSIVLRVFSICFYDLVVVGYIVFPVRCPPRICRFTHNCIIQCHRKSGPLLNPRCRHRWSTLAAVNQLEREMSFSVHSAAQNSMYFGSYLKAVPLDEVLDSDQLSLLRSLVSENPASVNAVDGVRV